MAVKWLLSGSSMVAQWWFDGGLMVVWWWFGGGSMANFLEPNFLSIKPTT
jgi:hypothetical protein